MSSSKTQLLVIYTLLAVASTNCVVSTDTIPGPQGEEGEPGAPGEPGDSAWHAGSGFITYNDGMVGIANNAPLALLTLGGGEPGLGEAKYPGMVQLRDGGNTSEKAGGIEFKSSSAGAGYGWRLVNPDLGNSSTPLIFQARVDSPDWTEIFRFAGDRVGIGTTDPRDKLHVRDATPGEDAVIYIEADTAQGGVAAYSSTVPWPNLADRVSLFSGEDTAGGLDLRADGPSSDVRIYAGGFDPGHEQVRIRSDGSIGIGTTNPQSSLHVASGYLQIPSRLGSPPTTDCNNVAHVGRMTSVYSDTAAGDTEVGLYVCLKTSAGTSWVKK